MADAPSKKKKSTSSKQDKSQAGSVKSKKEKSVVDDIPEEIH